MIEANANIRGVIVRERTQVSVLLCVDVMPTAGRPPPPFIDHAEVAYSCVAWSFVQSRGTGVQCL
jgi:hypothetical protein